MPLRSFYTMEPGVNWYAFDEGFVLISKNLAGIPDSEILYVHRSREALGTACHEIETDGTIHRVRKRDYAWKAYTPR
jgi:hypothetical protein